MKKIVLMVVVLAVVVALAIFLNSSQPEKPSTAAPAPGTEVKPVPKPDIPVATGVPEKPAAANPAVVPEAQPPVKTQAVAGTESATKPPAVLSPEAQACVEKLKDTKIPLETREDEIAKLAKSGTAEAFAQLVAAGDARIYLNWVAVQSLGSFRGTPSESAAKQYLMGRLADGDSAIACAAVRGFAVIAGDASIQPLAQALQNNRTRPDGHQEIVCTAIVKCLQETGSTATVPVLKSELERSEEKGWSLEYGSAIVAALKFNITDEARAALKSYADRLQAKLPTDQMAKKYYEDKIAEANAAAAK